MGNTPLRRLCLICLRRRSPPSSQRGTSPARRVLRQSSLHLVSISWFSNPTAATTPFFRTADFPVCRIAGFPTRRPFAHLARPPHGQARRLGKRRFIRLENLRCARTRCRQSADRDVAALRGVKGLLPQSGSLNSPQNRPVHQIFLSENPRTFPISLWPRHLSPKK